MHGLTTLFFVNIIEAAASVFLGLALFGIRPGWKKIVLLGLLQGFAVFIIRFAYHKFSIPMGTHMFFSLASYMIIIRTVGRVNWGLATAAALVSFIAVALSELIMWPQILKFSNLTLEQIMNDRFKHAVATHIGDSLMYILALVVGITRFSLIRPKD